jgi:hypothetical protein
VQSYDQFLLERAACAAAAACDYLLVYLFREPLREPMRVGAVNELLAVVSRRARLVPPVHPHMLRRLRVDPHRGWGFGRGDAGSALSREPGQHSGLFPPISVPAAQAVERGRRIGSDAGR